MRLQVFAISPSPANATNALRKSVEVCNSDVHELLTIEFYFDKSCIEIIINDGIISASKKSVCFSKT